MQVISSTMNSSSSSGAGFLDQFRPLRACLMHTLLPRETKIAIDEWGICTPAGLWVPTCVNLAQLRDAFAAAFFHICHDHPAELLWQP